MIEADVAAGHELGEDNAGKELLNRSHIVWLAGRDPPRTVDDGFVVDDHHELCGVGATTPLGQLGKVAHWVGRYPRRMLRRPTIDPDPWSSTRSMESDLSVRHGLSVRVVPRLGYE